MIFVKFFLSTIFSLLVFHTYGQKLEKVIVFNQDPHELYKWEQTDTSQLFYVKMVPKKKPLGVLVILPASGEAVESVIEQTPIHKLALKEGFLVVYPSLNWGSNQFMEEHKFLDTIFSQLVLQYSVSKDKFIMGGLSGGGMIALTYAERANKSPQEVFIIPKAIFALDPPLDFAHLYHHARKDVERNFSPPAVYEGNWLMEGFNKDFGGSPEEVPDKYINYSIYSHSEKDGGNAKYLLHTPILIYTEPGIEWQLKNRQRDLYDLNCTDISAMVNLLQLKGNKDAKLVVTHDKGIRPNGTKHPHSWSIMDAKECLSWILKHLK